VTVAASIEIACDAGFAWTLLADPRLAPEWVTSVADAEALELLPDGRARRVRFVGMPSVASIVYVIEYGYDDASRTMTWSTVGEADRRLDGEARIEDLGPGRCRLHYQLKTAAARGLPAWAHDSFAGDTPERVVGAFQRFVARRADRR
jgi:hypothetical protein